MNIESQIQNVNVDLIIPNRFQPRLTFDEQALIDLANSIKEHGIIQPLVLRRVNDKYEIIAGERRYKAAILAGLSEVPAIIKNIDDNHSAEVALVENVQRKNLNSMEEAKSYKKILDRGYLTQDALAQKMGISQSTLANKLRLLNLAPEVQNALMENRISERHARSLLLVNDKLKQVDLLNRIIAERLTVRQLDEIIKNDNSNGDNQFDDISDSKTENLNEVNENNTFESMFEMSSETEHYSFDTLDNTKEPVKVDNSQPEPEENKSSFLASLESLDHLDNNANVESNNSNDADKVFNLFNEPEYSSTDKDNLRLDSDEYFNPFNNINDNHDILIEDEKSSDNFIDDKGISSNKVIKKGDLSSVKNAYDNLKKEIEEAGFKIETEDFDFEDIYQLIIKIDKQA